MSLMPCPDCQRPISSKARACPHCGCPVVEPWGVRLERAWRKGFRHAWVAAAGFPLVVLLPAIATGGVWANPQALLSSGPWVLILGSWGFVAGLVAIGAAALLRSRRIPESEEADRWAWSVPAVLTVVAVFGAFVAAVG